MIKFNYSLNEIGAIIGIDLAMYHTGMSVYDVHQGFFAEFIPITVKNNSECKFSDLYDMLTTEFRRISHIYGRIMVVQERLPNQGGVHSTVQTLQSLAQAHAIMELAVHNSNNVELYDEHGIHSTSVKALFKTPDCPKPQKSDIRKALVKEYQLDDSKLTDDVSDSIAVVHTLLTKRWNQDIDERIKELKKEIKNLKVAHAKEQRQAEIDKLSQMKN